MGVVFRQSTKGTIVQLLGAFIGFLSTFFVIASFLTPEELGLTRVLVEASTLIGGYALLATNSSAVRYYPYFRTSDGRDNGFLWIVLTIPVVGILLFGGLYLAFKQPLIAFFAPEEGADLFGRYYYVVLPLMVFILYQTLMEVYGSLKGRIVFPKLSREVILRLLLLGAYLLYGLGRVDFDCFILLFVTSYGVAMLLSMGYVRHISPTSFARPSTPIPSEIRTDFTRYTLFTVLSSLGSSVVQRLDLFMVSSELGMAYAGIYTIAFFVVAVVEMPSRSISAITSPLASAALHEEDYTELNRLFRQVSNNQLLVGMLLLVLIWSNIDTLFWLIPRGEVYSEGKWVVLFLGLAKLVDLSFSFGNAILRYSKHYYWTLAYTLIVLAITVLLNLYFIGLWGISGAAIATMITLIVSYAFQQWVLWKKLQVTPINKEMCRILLIFVVLMVAHWLLPTTDYLLFDSVWRTLVLLLLAWLMLRRLATFNYIYDQLRSALVKWSKRESDNE